MNSNIWLNSNDIGNFDITISDTKYRELKILLLIAGSNLASVSFKINDEISWFVSAIKPQTVKVFTLEDYQQNHPKYRLTVKV